MAAVEERPVPERHARLPLVAKTIASVVLLASVALAGGFAWFAWRSGQASEPPPVSDGIVVLTGGAGRVELALRLLADGRARQLLVSGTGPGDVGAIVARAGLDAGLSARLPAERITLGRGARTTRGNALETADWVASHGIRSLIVVTSGYHLPRAMVELRRTLPQGVVVHPVPLVPHAPDGHDQPPWRLLLSEYAKWLGALAGLSVVAERDDEPTPPFGRGVRMDG
jgi:uncharacterized SAM-binding protein YcdF (DUF218 family)